MSEISPYTALVNNMIDLSLDSIGSQETVSSLNESETNANQALCAAWTTGVDTGSQAYQDLIGGPNGVNGAGGVSNATEMQNWISTYLEKGDSVQTFSQAFIQDILSKYSEFPSTDQGTNSSDQALINSCGSLVQAAAQSSEQPGQNAIQTLNTLGQRFQTNQGPLSSATTTILDGINNYSSEMQSISA